jgi:hypothetical protein
VPSPETLWLRRFFRALVLQLAVAFLVAALLLALLTRPVVYDRLGHLARAFTFTVWHVPLGTFVVVSVAALWAGRAGKRARSAKVVALAFGGLLLAELVASPRRHVLYLSTARELGWWQPGEDPTGQLRKFKDMFGVERAFTPEGLRGTASVPRRFEGSRVVCLGDSFTWGSGAEDGQDWPAVASGLAGFPFVNGGQLGYGVDQMATLYATRLVGFDHTAVIVCAIDDDLRRATDRFFLAHRKPYTPPAGEVEPVPAPASALGIAWSPESQVLAPWLESGRHVLRAVGLLPDRWSHLDDALARVRKTAGARKAYLVTLSTRGDAGRYFSRMDEAATRAGFDGSAGVDLTGAYADDGHPNREGHARIAAAATRLVTAR